MYHEIHGGDCCGLKHLAGFPTTVTEEGLLEQTIDAAEYEMESGRSAVEIVLTDKQLKTHHKVIKKVGYQFCGRWFNPNSGNYCNMFLWAPKIENDKSLPWVDT